MSGSTRRLQRRQVSYFPEGYWLSPSWLRHYDVIVDSGRRGPEATPSLKKREAAGYNRRIEVVRPTSKRTATKPESADEVREP